jgi:tetratricopeptide (TPR) repeat protein
MALKSLGPNRYLLAQKAYLSYQRGEVQQSLAALQDISQHFQATPDIAIQEAHLLSMQGKYREAFAAMDKVRAKASLEDVPFWHLLAVLAWEIHDHEAALNAEKKLYLLGAASKYDLQRLIMLVGSENPEAALAVALHGWKKYQLSLFYFESLTYAGQAQQWDTLGKLLYSVTSHDPQGLRAYATYWLAMGQWANAVKNYPAAERAYAEALRINPEDAVAKNNLLWMLMDSGNVKALKALLVGDTQDPPVALRDVVLNAQERLGNNALALFLDLQGPREQPGDIRQLLNQASLWDATGRPGLAWTLRQAAMAKSVERLQTQLKWADPRHD